MALTSSFDQQKIKLSLFRLCRPNVCRPIVVRQKVAEPANAEVRFGIRQGGKRRQGQLRVRTRQWTTSGANVIKLFTAVIYKFSHYSVCYNMLKKACKGQTL